MEVVFLPTNSLRIHCRNPEKSLVEDTRNTVFHNPILSSEIVELGKNCN